MRTNALIVPKPRVQRVVIPIAPSVLAVSECILLYAGQDADQPLSVGLAAVQPMHKCRRSPSVGLRSTDCVRRHLQASLQHWVSSPHPSTRLPPPIDQSFAFRRPHAHPLRRFDCDLICILRRASFSLAQSYLRLPDFPPPEYSPGYQSWTIQPTLDGVRPFACCDFDPPGRDQLPIRKFRMPLGRAPFFSFWTYSMAA